jgi:hypothetical protein
MEQLLARLAELKAEGDAIMQQLIQAGMPPEQIVAAIEGGQQMPQPGMGAGFDPSAGVPGGPEVQPFSGGGIPQGGPPMGMPNGGMTQGLLGPR